MEACHGYGRSPGACGELVQGFLSDGTPFHVTCPIDRFSEVEVRLAPSEKPLLIGFGSSTSKMRRACELTLGLLGCGPVEVRFKHRSALERSKGMASSTADVVAMARAVSDALGQSINAKELASIAASVERSDGVMYEGVHAVNHVTGKRIASFDWYPSYTILMCTPRSVFHTSRADLAVERRSKPNLDPLLNLMKQASDDRDIRLFSDICSESARLNQRYLPNPLFSILEPQLATLGAEGACVAHTGTLVGLLFAGGDAGMKAKAGAEIASALLPQKVKFEIVLLGAAAT
jgi:L-threonine kinase